MIMIAKELIVHIFKKGSWDQRFFLPKHVKKHSHRTPGKGGWRHAEKIIFF
jgi:hypothetical protein